MNERILTTIEEEEKSKNKERTIRSILQCRTLDHTNECVGVPGLMYEC